MRSIKDLQPNFYPASSTVTDIFEARVAQSPGKPALAEHDLVLTYRELNDRANRLANFLVGLGVGPQCLVGCCLPRSTEMVIALLAIFKAGGALLPLDPNQPAARLAQMVEDAAPSVVLSAGFCRALLPNTRPIVELDGPDTVAAVGCSSIGPHSATGNLAYMMFPAH